MLKNSKTTITKANKNTRVEITKDKIIKEYTHEFVDPATKQKKTRISVLVKVSEDFSFWLNESKVYPSIYAFTVSIYIDPDKEYDNSTKDSATTKVIGRDIIEYLQRN